MESRMRMGKLGITMIVSDRSRIIFSVKPPLYPATSPSKVPITRPITEAITPRIMEFFIANVNIQKTSWPKLVVPRRCAEEGGRLLRP
jgi:hypothetical protein